MERAGLGRHIEVLGGDYTERAGAEAGELIAARARLPTALFAANDLVAVGAIDAIERRGHGVPADVSVVGYDNTFFARLGRVSLTTVDQPARGDGPHRHQAAGGSHGRRPPLVRAHADHADAHASRTTGPPRA